MQPHSNSYVLTAFTESAWAILPEKLVALEDVVARHVSGDKLTAEEIQARIHGAERPQEQSKNRVAVLPLFGTIFPRANLMTDMSGATSAERFGARFTELLNDPTIGAIVLDVNSPGGNAFGVDELSSKIYGARGQKPIVAVVNHLMASAAYWIGTAADEIVMTPSSEAGSIGVFMAHGDYSAAYHNAGIKVSLISAGRYKVEANPYQPLTEDAKSYLQAKVDETYEAFVESVARNRGVDKSVVLSDFGEGRMLGAKQAVALGMADRIGTLDETIERLSASLSPVNLPQNKPSAAVEVETLPESVSSEPEQAGPDPRKVERLRNYLKVYRKK